MKPVIPALLADSPGTRIRDYMNIQIGRIGNQAFRQRRLAEYAFSRGRTPPDHNFGDTGKPCKFRNLIRNILSVDGFDMRAKLPCQPNILPQPFLVIFIHFSSGGCFHEKGGKVPTECPCHPCSGADDLRVGWRG